MAIRPKQRVNQILWCVIPFIDAISLVGSSTVKQLVLPTTARPFRLPSLASYGDCLVATTTTNQRRSLDPITRGETTRVPVNTATRWASGIVRHDADARAVRQWGDAALASVDRTDATATWRNAVARAALLLDIYRHTDLSRFSAVLVGTQHDLAIRALILAAQDAAVPVVYVPHAPVGNNPQYSDLPTPFAALRGAREAEYYAQKFGVELTHLDVVGNPATNVLSSAMPSIRADAPGVLALSPHPPEVTRQIVRLISASGIDELIVAPHPRSNRAEIAAAIPKGWRLYGGQRTLNLLQTGPQFLIQYSSGVAWESAALGIPTATIRLDHRSSYPFLEDETIYPTLRVVDDVRAFVSAASRGETDRDRLRGYAIEWCALDGEAAAARVRELLRVAPTTLQRRPPRLLDGWHEQHGVARAMSWLPPFTN